MNPPYPVCAKIVGEPAFHQFGDRFADPPLHTPPERGEGDINGGSNQHDDSGVTLED